MNKVKKLGKYVQKLAPDELKKISGGVNADEQDRQLIKFPKPGLPALPGLPGLPSGPG